MSCGKPSLPEFVSQNFDIVFQSQRIQSIEEADEFLLAERHGDQNDGRKIAEFVDAFGSDSVVFREAYPLFFLMSYKGGAPDLSQLTGKPLSVRNLTVYGWDHIEDGQLVRTQRPLYAQKIDNGELLTDHEVRQAEEDWEKRTQAFETSLKVVQTLRELKQIVHPSLVFKRTILIGGAGHFKRTKWGNEPVTYAKGPAGMVIVKHPSFDFLDEARLHRFLNERKAVVLFPKGLLDHPAYK